MNDSGVYRIRNVENDKVYIGSTVNIKNRIEGHKKILNSYSHYNRYLQRAWNKHGESAFRFESFLCCHRDDLIFYEQRAMDAYQTADKRYGYNLSPTAGSSLGRKFTKATKQRIADKATGRKHSKKTRLKMSQSNVGKKQSEEHKRKNSESKKGIKHSKERRHNISKALTGRKLSEEHKQNIRGYKHTDQAKEQISIKLKGRKKPESMKRKLKGNTNGLGYKHTEEAKRKMSEMGKSNWQKRRERNESTKTSQCT